MKKNCQMCGEPFIGKRSDAKYCSNSCKAKYFELKDKKNLLPKQGLSGLSFTDLNPKMDIQGDDETIPKPIIEHKTKLRNVDIDDLTPFDNILNDEFEKAYDIEAEGREPKKKDDTTKDTLSFKFLNGTIQTLLNTETVLPEKYVEKRVEKPNPIYQNNLKKIENYNVSIKKCHDELLRLTSELRAVEHQTGNGYVALGIAGGALFAQLTSTSKNSENPVRKEGLKKYARKIAKLKKENESIGKRNFMSTIFSIAAGAAVGWVLKENFNSNNKISKAEAIKFYLSNIKEINAIKEGLGQEKERIVWENAFVKTKLIETVKVENPDYQRAIILLKKQQSPDPDSSQNHLSGLQDLPVIDQNNPFTDLFHKTKTNTRSEINNPLETDKISSMKKVAGLKFQLLNFNGKWLDLFGQPQTNFFCVIHGMSGEGKTNFSIQFAKYLAENFGNVLYISGEEGFAPTFQQKIKMLGAENVKRLYAADIRTGQEILADIQNKYHFLVIDSVNNMDIDPDMMKAIRNKFRQSGIIAICQSTKDGKIRGSYQIVHDSDIAVKVMDGIAVTTKNRFKEKNQEFDVFAVYKKPKLTIVKKTGTDDNEDLIFGNTV